MTELFEKVEDEQWMNNIKRGAFETVPSHHLKLLHHQSDIRNDNPT